DSCDPAFGCQYGPLDCDDNDVCTEDACDPTVGCVYLPAPCPGDLDCNGIVGAFDLAVLLGSWGPCDGCPADIFDDGDVNAGDLAILLGNWGPCL
ncbi:MAG: hypothetical protein IH895_07990, partial [Planctomycetes bacterium]|nr:hypothetical protein [Planctomycetota bacterium]